MENKEIEKIKEDAKNFIKENKKKIIEDFASTEKFPLSENPMSFFMAGSAGAGKTETSKLFINLLNEKINKMSHNKDVAHIVRIDADEIREIIPGYTGNNSSYFQESVSLGINKIFDHVIKKKLNFLLDGTFASWHVSENNIEICIRKNRQIYILYIYQDPILCWNLIKAREKKEGRVVPIDDFIEDLFLAKENVNKAKEIYKNKINLSLIIKSYDNKFEKFYDNIDSIDNYIKVEYNKESLKSKLLN